MAAEVEAEVLEGGEAAGATSGGPDGLALQKPPRRHAEQRGGCERLAVELPATEQQGARRKSRCGDANRTATEGRAAALLAPR